MAKLENRTTWRTHGIKPLKFSPAERIWVLHVRVVKKVMQRIVFDMTRLQFVLREEIIQFFIEKAIEVELRAIL